MSYTFMLTSPHMGAKNNPGPKNDPYAPHIKAIQNHMKSLGTYHSALDGEYGPMTAQAVWDTKNYVLGYLRPDKVAGDRFYAYISGLRKPNPAMRALARNRHNSRLTMSYKIFLAYVSRLGETEHPANSNRSYASLWYGYIGPWCAMAFSWAANRAGSKIFKRMLYEAYVPTILSDARNGHNKLKLHSKYGLMSGLGICFKWPGESTAIADHIGCVALEDDLRRECPTALEAAVVEFGPLGSGYTWTIEGNTSVGSNSNGGIQMIRKRNLNDGTVAGIFSVTG